MNKVLNLVLLTPHSSIDPYLPCSAAIKFQFQLQQIIYCTYYTYHTDSCTLQYLHTGKTDHICHAQNGNYIAPTHNITHSPCTSTCTTHPALPTTLASTTLCTQQAHKAYLCKWRKNGTRHRDGVKVLWCHSHLVWLFLLRVPSQLALVFIQKTLL